MKISLLTLTLTFFSLSLFGQISITNDYFPQEGDTLLTAFDLMPGQIDISAGADMTWDYRDLQGRARTTIFDNAAEGDSSYLFPNADLVIKNGALGESYYKNSSRDHQLLGYIGAAGAGIDLQVIVRFDPEYDERIAPLSYQDEINTTSAIVLPIPFDSLPDFLSDSIAVQPDSVRLLIAIEKEHLADAWGKVMIPGGEYDVLREKVTEYRETRLEALVSLGPLSTWIDLTAALAGSFDELGRDTLVNYRYLSNTEKEIIANVSVDAATNQVQSVGFKSNGVQINTTSINSRTSNLFAYPNPAIDRVRFDLVNLDRGTYNLNIFNILGTKVLEKQILSSQQNQTIELSLANLKKGTYLYSLTDERGKTITTKRLVIIRP